MLSAARKIALAKRHGIINPIIAYQEARRAHLEFAVLCAVLEQESSGGHNVFGHDDSIYRGAGTVTKEKYLAYKRMRQQTGKMQGVGPMQLTWYAFQDQADACGGCWKKRCNIRVGCKVLYNNIKRHGLWHGLRAYNGSATYANEVMRKVNKWRRIFGQAQ